MVVVSASKTESTVINAPATISVVGADTIATSPAQNFGDLLRSTPGLNVIQTSARDINMTSRQSTSTLATSQLVLLDGRSIYLDFFGLVLWDFVPQSPSEIKQIEVVRGPASAVWGANALTGVVNIITKSPARRRGLQPEPAGRALQPRARARARTTAPATSTARTSPTPRPRARSWPGASPPATSTPTRSRAPRAGSPRLPSPGRRPLPQRGGQGGAGRHPGGRRALSPDQDGPRAASRTTAPASPRSTLRARPGARQRRQRRPHHLPGRLLGHHRNRAHGHRALPDPERLLPGLRQGAVDAATP